MASSGRERRVALLWSAAALAVVLAMSVAMVVIVRDPSAELFARWTLALFFLGAPLVWLARRHRLTWRGTRHH